MDCCAIDQLCDRCVDEWTKRFQGVCYARACTWVTELAARRRRPWVPWPVDSEVVHAMALGWVEDLTRDERLKVRLAAEVERCAAQRWSAYQPPPVLAMPSA